MNLSAPTKQSIQLQKILILTAIPHSLRLDKEIREIEDAIRRATRRNLFDIRTRTAVRPQDIRRAIAEEKPHIVHFCGHGLQDGSLLLEDDGGNNKPVPPQGLATLFKQHGDYVSCVLFNACHSIKTADAISEHINYCIGMNQEIADKAAIAFAQGFYDGLGYESEGNQDVFTKAFNEGLVAIALEDVSQESIPVLKNKVLEPHLQKKEPQINPILIQLLEYPNGSVPLDSPFYLERDEIESICYQTIEKPAALIRIKAPNLMGKTSLVRRILAEGVKQKYQGVYLDFGGINKEVITNLDKFLRWLCSKVSLELDLDNQVDEAWNNSFLGSNDNCTAYFRKHILKQLNSPLILILDEVDRLFPYSEVLEDFFGMLRSWHEKGKTSEIWKQLRLVLAHSTEVYIPLDLNQSPFNAGIPVELKEFNQQQIENLATRHGVNSQDNLLAELRTMVGGHPYLLRLAMYNIAMGKISFQDLLESAATEAGIYNNHLRSLLEILHSAPDLLPGLKRVVNSSMGVELDSMQIYKLHSLGLVQRENNHVTPRCQLYRDYFRRVL
ncbi:MAG: AAA-like domain-containing protein [Rivularia sp. (in: Bacteria)]|nr:AAA-like domain-containing protein [Rivularia sp. MS3]